MTCTREEAAAKILQLCQQLCTKGLIARTWGNVSMRLSEKTMLITPSGRAYETMTAEDLVEVSIADLRWEGQIKPSSEKEMHARLYRLRPECRFIIHTHQSNASAVSILGEHIDLTSFTARVFCKEDERAVLGPVIPCAFYGMATTKRLAKNVARAVQENPGSQTVLLRYHGAVCMGADDAGALQAAEILEKVCGRVYEKRIGETLAARVAPSEMRFTVRGKNGICRIHTRTPYVMEMSRRGKQVFAYLDDMAQIGGFSYRCIPEDPTPAQYHRAVKGRNVVFVENDGAICMAADPREAEAVAIVLEKNCQAANLALKKAIPPVNGVSARLERTIYLQKYAKLRDADGSTK